MEARMDAALLDELERKFQKELNAGTVGLLLLATLAQAGEPRYGYDIAKELEERAPIIKLGTLYPVLRSLESLGLLSGRVEPSVSGPPRKYYTITQDGRKALVSWSDQWSKTSQCVHAMLEGVRHV
jgi:PadR family transcriptional regulator PadR